MVDLHPRVNRTSSIHVFLENCAWIVVNAISTFFRCRCSVLPSERKPWSHQAITPRSKLPLRKLELLGKVEI